jgi:hypothetical protein
MNPIGAIIGLMAILYLVSKRSPGSTGATSSGLTTPPPGDVVTPTTDQIAATLRGLVNTYGAAIAKNVERIYRLETANFTSGQFRATNTAGMQAAGSDPYTWPFGWKKRGTNPGMFVRPVVMNENATGTAVAYVAFIHFGDAAEYLAKVMQERGNDPALWRTSDPNSDTARSYRAAVARINPQFV